MAILIETPVEATTSIVHFFTAEEYLQRERSLPKEEKNEYINGRIIRMGGASLNHNKIHSRIMAQLLSKLSVEKYEIFGSDMRVNNPISGSYCYPDITIVREEPLLQDNAFDNLLNPCLIIEILSPGTEEYDRNDKFTAYQSIVTLQEYMLVSSEKIQIEYFRKETASQWQRVLYNTGESQIGLLHGDVILSAADIYKNVKL